MAPTGKGTRRILFVAEAPGEREDGCNEQLVGKSGKLLKRVLRSIGEELNDSTKTNAVICRPPDNVMKDVYVECCRPNLLKTINRVRPTVIVLLGGTAVQSLLAVEWLKGVGGLERWEGWTIPSNTFNAWICPTFHPSFLLRMNEPKMLMKLFKQHLRQAYRLERQGPPEEPSLKDLEKEVEIITSPSSARKRLRDLLRRKGRLAFDYEATGLKPERKGHRIVSCSFCYEGEDTFAIPVDDRIQRLISRVLLKETLLKIASNLKFEERWTLVKMGHGVAGWLWDTMLAAHILNNKPGICSLKFQAYVLLGIGDYDSAIAPYLKSKQSNGFNQIDKIPIRDLLLYNGLDSLLEYKVAMRQMDLIPQ